MDYLIHIAIFICIYSILALSLDLIVGKTGMLSVSHAAYFALGAYVTAIALTEWKLPFLIAVLFSLITSGIVGFIVGKIISHLEDDFYTLSSLAVVVLINSILINWDSVTRGTFGIPGIPRPEIFGFVFRSNGSFLILALLFLLIVALVYHWVSRSHLGRVLEAIREDEGAIQVFGFQSSRFKLFVFVLSSILASLAGVLYATYISFIDPTLFTVAESVLVMSMIIFGGLASLPGAIIGAAVLTLLPELLRLVGLPQDIAAHLRHLIYGLILVLLMRYRPQGILGKYRL